MFGYLTKDQAIRHGFTHKGSYFGVPIYLGSLETDCPMVAVRHVVFEPLMTIAGFIEGLLHALFWPNHEPGFQFKVWKALE